MKDEMRMRSGYNINLIVLIIMILQIYMKNKAFFILVLRLFLKGAKAGTGF